MRQHRGEKIHKCHLCPFTTLNRREFNEHKLVHSNEKPFKCEHCSTQFRQKKELKKHLTDGHCCRLEELIKRANDVDQNAADLSSQQENVSDAAQKVCSLCFDRVPNSSALRQHLRSLHLLTGEQIEKAVEKCISVADSPPISRDLKETEDIPLTLLNPTAIPTIIVTCSPDNVEATIVLHDSESGEKLSCQDSVATVEAIFIIDHTQDIHVSVMVDPQILTSETLLQSLQSALEQNETMRSIAAEAYRRHHSQVPSQTTVLAEGDQPLDCRGIDAHSISLASDSAVDKGHLFSTIDSTVLHSS